MDAVRELRDVTIAFFYCKHSDPTRNCFISVARSLLSQVLDQNPDLLSYFFEIASITSPTILSSNAVAKKMLETSFNSCGKLYIIVDGLDECDRTEMREISIWLQGAVDSTPQVNSMRCLIVSQDDGNAQKNLKDFAKIEIKNQNRDDLKRYTTKWQEKLEQRFVKLRPESRQLGNFIFAKAQGMSTLPSDRQRC